MEKTKLIVNTESKSYPIYFGNNILGSTHKLLKANLPNVNKICIISDGKVPSSLSIKLIKSLRKYDLKIYKISVNEKIKNLKIANNIIEWLLKNNFSRSDCVISFGGGIVGDLSAFIASLTKRGLKFINIPTTLLAQSDASVGGKTGVNSAEGKNLIGTFYQPDFVLIDILTLNSLSRREMICGYGEILKHSLISDKKFFLWLLRNAKKIINKKNRNILEQASKKSCKIKSQIVSKDERERNLRMILNFGHTFAHGFEAAKSFSKKLNHGEAVLLGISIANELAYDKKILSSNDLNLIKRHYISLNLPNKLSKFFKKKEINKIVYFMQSDKKNFNEKINLILLKKIGKATKPNTFSIDRIKLKNFLLKCYK